MSFEAKISDPAVFAQRARALARPLVFTNGVFDIIHRGHVTYLARARALGASLVVALNSDASARRLGKGDDRPINTLADRMAVIAALEAVALVTWFDEDTPLARHPGVPARAPREGRRLAGGQDRRREGSEVLGRHGALDRVRARPLHDEAPVEDPRMNDLSASPALIERLKSAVGERNVITDDHGREPFENDWRGQFHGRAAAIVKPASTDEVARVVQMLAKERVGIVRKAATRACAAAPSPTHRAGRSW
jgi:cytidyltransferase-like protein